MIQLWQREDYWPKEVQLYELMQLCRKASPMIRSTIPSQPFLDRSIWTFLGIPVCWAVQMVAYKLDVILFKFILHALIINGRYRKTVFTIYFFAFFYFALSGNLFFSIKFDKILTLNRIPPFFHIQSSMLISC